ncbi:tetratricopeptide repeat-containing sensor histidine kinase [uncultured Winogradskyella sp.]|uniref:tetratricopeptide repeat-containing sensor histidine kinase n=1 Tax=uncultured Winogradskyella sp. TaxID=395353 RepID=UPI002634519D|nr:tetratricopeptide repeat-containing sensor histidine kinase [uncultured Winogradskyella sp.]
MKPIKTSFLFLYLIFSSYGLVCSDLNSQTYIDSLSHYSSLALKPEKSDDLFKAFEYFNSSYKKAINQKKYNAAINLLYYQSSIEYKKGAYEESEKTAVKGLNHIHEMNITPYTISIKKSFYNLLGLIYIEKFDKIKAIELYNKTIEFAESIEDTIKVYNNLSLVFKNHNEYNNAKDELLKAYALLPRTKDTLLKATIYDNLGYTYSKIDKVKGLTLMQKALSIRKFKQEKIKVYTSYNHLAKYFHNVNDTVQAIEYALKNYELANELNSSSYRLDALSLLVDLKRHEFVDQFKLLSDSISKVEKQELSRFMLVKYDYSEFKRKALESELEKEQQESKTIIAFLIALFILILSLFLYFVLKSKHKKDKIKEAYQKETELSKKVHDELANDMSDLMNFVENDIEVTQTKKSLLLDNIEDIYMRTRDISTETGSIDLVNFSESIKHLLMQHNKKDTKVVTNNINAIDWQNVSEHKKVVIYRCLQELLVNMKKHSKAKVVSVVFKNHNKKKEIRYVDDGVGFSPEEKKLNGLANVESRIKNIQGTFNFITSKGNGFKATLKFNN